MEFICLNGPFIYNPQKYIREKFLLSNPQKFPPSKLIRYVVAKLGIVANILNWDHIMTHNFLATLYACAATACMYFCNQLQYNYNKL